MHNFLRKFTIVFTSFSLSFFFAIALGYPVVAEEIDPTTIPPITFSDVKEGNMNYVPILELTQNGYINGYDDGTFRSRDNISRAEALKIIMEFLDIFNEEEKAPEESPFTDVETSAWYAKYISQAKTKGIADGYSDGTFKPNKTVSLAEALKLIIASIPNYQPNPPTEDPFADVPASEWFSEYAAYAKEREILNITLENKINPGDLLTRGQFSAIVYKLKNFSMGYHFGKATFYGAAVQGSGTASGETFDMNQFTAAHKTLSFGTLVDVKNLANGKVVQVRITDRGPYGPGRELDLTSGAFKEISELSLGVINIQYKVADQPIVKTTETTDPI